MWKTNRGLAADPPKSEINRGGSVVINHLLTVRGACVCVFD